MSPEQSLLYATRVKPGLHELLSLLRLDLTYTRAAGEHLFWDQEGRETKVIDFLGGYGSCILGHNLPAVSETLERCIREQRPVHAQLSIRSGAAELADQLVTLLKRHAGLRSDYFVHLANTGTEAVEAALKHALLAWTKKREHAVLGLKLLGQHETAALLETVTPVMVAVEGAFHGKTAGSLSVTHAPRYSSMFDQRPLSTVFLPRGACAADVRQVFEEHTLSSHTGRFSRLACAIVEPIQGEGGVHVLSTDLLGAFAAACRADEVPLIVDEIQSGLFRTGSLLASSALGLDPDYLLLGKSLGGGLAKISALLVRDSHYVPEFGLLHTSTFAEDDVSCAIASTTLRLLDEDATFEARAVAFEATVRSGLESIRMRYPGVIADVRGKGFLLGIELDNELNGYESVLFGLLRESGHLSYLLASYLLHRHGLRVAPALSEALTLRIEPCAFISEASVRALLTGVEDVARLLHEGCYKELIAHLFAVTTTPYIAPRKQKTRSNAKVVTFLTHWITPQDIGFSEPALDGVPEPTLERLANALAPSLRSRDFFEQEIEGTNGARVLLRLRGIPATSAYFEASLRQRDTAAFKRVREAVTAAHAQGSAFVGLGQYTSIVTNSGVGLLDIGACVTTGNSLTVGMALRAVECLVSERGASLSDLRVGVVGAAGNICTVLAQLLADHARSLVAIHREPLATSPKFQAAVERILSGSPLARERLLATTDLSQLSDCDVVVVGTNTVRQVIRPEHLKRDAIVVDISVPSNVHPSVLADRPDVRCIQGGLVRLPKEQKFRWTHATFADGQVFACLAETVTAGLLEHKESLSVGPLSKQKVEQVLAMAEAVGMSLGSMKTVRLF